MSKDLEPYEQALERWIANRWPSFANDVFRQPRFVAEITPDELDPSRANTRPLIEVRTGGRTTVNFSLDEITVAEFIKEVMES